MNILPKNASSDQLGSSSAQWGAIYGVTVYGNGTELAKITRATDAFGALSDITTNDATSLKHGFMPKTDKVKLDAIEAAATADQTDAEIETAYNNRVAQASAPEVAAATSTSIRRYSVKNIADIADVRIAAAASAFDSASAVTAIDSATNDTDSIAQVLGSGVLTYNLRRKSSGLASTEGSLGADSSGVFVTLGTTSNTAAAGNDARFLTTDEKAAVTASDSPAAGNPFQTLTGVKTIKLDDFATPDDNTDLDATAGRHGLFAKLDKTKLDAIEALATADQTDTEIETAYNNRVAQVSAPEIAAGSETAIRRFSPANVAGIRDAIAQVSAPEIAAGTETAIRRYSPANVAAIADARIAASTTTAGAHVVLSYTTASGNSGGSAAATTWETRPVNTEEFDSSGICTLSANQFTLPAGTYDIRAWSVGYQVNAFATRLYNVTSAAAVTGLVAGPGISAAAASWSERAIATLNGRFTIGATTTLRLEQYSAAAKATNGFGLPMSLSGVSEVYAQILLTKIA